MQRWLLQFLVVFVAVVAGMFVYDVIRSRRVTGDFGTGAAAERIRIMRSDFNRATPPAKLAGAEYFLSNGRWPANNQEAGLPEPDSFRGESLRRLEIAGPLITLTFDARSGKDDGRIILTGEPTPAMGIDWRCTSPDLPDVATSLGGCTYGEGPPPASSAEIVPATGPAVNLIANGDFERDVTGWTTSSDGSLEFVPPDAGAASGTLKVMAAADGKVAYTAALTECFRSVPGTAFRFGARVLIEERGTAFAIFNCSGFSDEQCAVAIAPQLAPVSQTYAPDGWEALGPFSGTLPKGANYVRCGLMINGVAGSSSISARLDDVYFESVRPN